MASDTRPPTQRERVVLRPGFHLADWFRLAEKKVPAPSLRRISSKELAQHKSQFDCWTVYNGRVYDISNYLPYHPGGEEKLLLGAGRDCTHMFNKYHAWVNVEPILGKYCVGILINEENDLREDEEEEEGKAVKT